MEFKTLESGYGCFRRGESWLIASPFKVVKFIENRGRIWAIDEDGKLNWTSNDGEYRWHKEARADGAGWWIIEGKKIVDITDLVDCIGVITGDGCKYLLTGTDNSNFIMEEEKGE